VVNFIYESIKTERAICNTLFLIDLDMDMDKLYPKTSNCLFSPEVMDNTENTRLTDRGVNTFHTLNRRQNVKQSLS